MGKVPRAGAVRLGFNKVLGSSSPNTTPMLWLPQPCSDTPCDNVKPCAVCVYADEVDAFLTKRGAQSEHEATLQVWVLCSV